jgi:polyisoprenoid-binding protein YceI
VRYSGPPVRGLLLATMLCAASTVHAAAVWVADPGRGRLEFTGTLAGGAFDGRFTRFAPEIVFDPADLPGSRFRVDVDPASADTQEADRDAALKGPDFFAVERFPTARFEATRFTATGPGRYTARGKLTLRGVTRDVTLNFTFRPAADGTTAELTGTTSLRRLQFGVGQGEWRDTQWLGDDVQVRFALMLTRQP